MLNEDRLAMLRLGLSISFHHQMALVVHVCEKLSSLPSLAVEAQGQESHNGMRLFRAEMDHVGPAVRKRNRQIFVFGYCIIRVVLRPLACWNCGVESRRGHGCLPRMSVVCCQVEISATGRSHVQGIPAECARVVECD